MTRPIPSEIVMERDISKYRSPEMLPVIAAILKDPQQIYSIAECGSGTVILEDGEEVVLFMYRYTDTSTFTYLIIHGDTKWFTHD